MKKGTAAIIIKDNQVFATQRGYGEFKDWWEFPDINPMSRVWSGHSDLVMKQKTILIENAHKNAIFAHAKTTPVDLSIVRLALHIVKVSFHSLHVYGRKSAPHFLFMYHN